MRRVLMRYGAALFLFVLVVVMALALDADRAQTQSVEVFSYSVGDTINYNGRGTPGSTVTVMVSCSTPATVNGGSYELQLNDINVPACTITISVHPVSTVNFGGSQWIEILGVGGWTPEFVRNFEPVDEVGSYSYQTGGGRYKARVFGEAVSGQSVTVDVFVSQQVQVDGNGGYTASISTANLLPGIYYVSQDGVVVARVYLSYVAPSSYVLNLHAGWNLISLPITPENNQISYIFSKEQQSKIDVIWDYNGGSWLFWTTEDYWRDRNTLSTLDPRTGYWIYCYQSIDVTIYGSTPPAPKTWADLANGWNCIGYPSVTSTDVKNLWGHADVVWRYDSGQWAYYTTEPDYANKSTLNNLDTGYGYWVYKIEGT